MNVYVETNFVLELALLQEQQESCQQLLNLAEADRINLILPAFSFTEPYETLIRREKKRRNLSQNLHQELSQLGRSLPYQQQVRTYQEITEFLVNSGKEEKERFQIIVEKLLITKAGIIPFDYKINVINGKTEFIYVSVDRENANKRNIYNRNWEPLYFTWANKNKNTQTSIPLCPLPSP
jgi:hypothetical protein